MFHRVSVPSKATWCMKNCRSAETGGPSGLRQEMRLLSREQRFVRNLAAMCRELSDASADLFSLMSHRSHQAPMLSQKLRQHGSKCAIAFEQSARKMLVLSKKGKELNNSKVFGAHHLVVSLSICKAVWLFPRCVSHIVATFVIQKHRSVLVQHWSMHGCHVGEHGIHAKCMLWYEDATPKS